MADPHVDNREHGHVTWWKGFGPTATFDVYSGPCTHMEGISHLGRCVAWGWDFRHYTLDECQRCHARAWHDERMRPTTPWLATQPSLIGV
ncbi:hypothetical protein [Nocardia sp. NPDC057227]|uniref:hypothetical protein n=1 Tax=Nocardia sp. NPDC057227 TaxID=3346056 RepID=UPI003643B9C2